MGLAGLAAGLLFYLVAPSTTVPAWTLAAILIALLCVCYVLIAALKRAINESFVALPRLLTVIDHEDDVVLLLEPSQLFGTSSRVSIYNVDAASGFELLIAYGNVATIQADGKIQVIVEEWQSKGEAYRPDLCARKVAAIESTIVRPSAPKVTSHRSSYVFESESPTADEIEEIIRTFALTPKDVNE